MRRRPVRPGTLTTPVPRRFRSAQALALVWSCIVGYSALVVLGLVTEFTDPLRNRVDNALLLLGAIGLVNAYLARAAQLFEETPAVRASIGVVAVLSALALGLADFGSYRGIGWGVKAVGVGLLGLVLASVVRGPSRSSFH